MFNPSPNAHSALGLTRGVNERQADDELVIRDGVIVRGGRVLVLGGDEGALAVEPREVRVDRRQEEAGDVWRGRHLLVLGDDAIRRCQ